MEIDDETPVSAGRIKELIQDAVKKDTKQHQSEINKLRETINRSKNFSRGAESSSKKSAPLKKKHNQKQSNQKGKEKKEQQPPQQKKKKEKERGTSPVPKGKGSPKGKEHSRRPSGQKKKNTNSNSTRPQRTQR